MRAPFTYDDLRSFEGKRVRLLATTGELADAIVCTVFEEERDLNYRILSTTRPDRYVQDKPGTTYIIPFDYIAEISLAE